MAIRPERIDGNRRFVERRFGSDDFNQKLWNTIPPLRPRSSRPVPERHFIYEKYTVDAHHDLDLIKSENIGVQALTMSEEVEIRSVCLLRLKPFP